jgi:hypothetical protein
MVMLGQANSHMRDFFDLAVIARRTELDGATRAAAIATTFARRHTALPAGRPLSHGPLASASFALGPTPEAAQTTNSG